MEKLIILFIYQTLYIVKVKIEDKYFMTLECLYPLNNIKNEYFDENINFETIEGLSELKKVCHQFLIPFHYFATENQSQIEQMLLLLPKENIEEYSDEEIFDYITNLHSKESKYLSKNCLKYLLNNHISYHHKKTTLFNNIWVYQDEEIKIENCMKLAIKQNIKSFVFFWFFDDEFSGENFRTILNLESDLLKSELVLQEFFSTYYSAPRISIGENLSYTFYIERRFQKFSEKKKTQVKDYSEKMGLNLYQKHIEKWQLSNQKKLVD